MDRGTTVLVNEAQLGTYLYRNALQLRQRNMREPLG